MTFSICIPNYNYARYLGETIESVRAQSCQEFEIVVADNCSTDGSVDLVRAVNDPRIRVSVNRRNVGFAANLDRAAAMARGDVMILLSSDDVMRPGALECYRTVIEALGPDRNVVLTSSMDVIDGQGAITGRMFLRSTWRDEDRDEALSAQLGCPVYRTSGREMLRRSLLTLKNPFLFCSTAYPRRVYEQVEGYGAGRTINPDKWFHWKLCAAADEVVYIDRHLFAWRWHPTNQTAQEGGALKYLVDDYLSTIEVPETDLQAVGLTRAALAAAYAEHLIGRNGLATLARYHDTARARRVLRFGRAVYPSAMWRNPKVWLLSMLVATGPLAPWLARAVRRVKNGGRPVPPAPWTT